MRARAAYIYVRGEFWYEANCLQQAVDEVMRDSFRHMRKDFWERMHADQDLILMCMFTLVQEPISAEKRQVYCRALKGNRASPGSSHPSLPIAACTAAQRP
jgi:hypothetical protein